jgi:hypothetical protein
MALCATVLIFSSSFSLPSVDVCLCAIRSYYDAAQQLLVDGAIPMGVLRASGPLGYSCVMSPSNEAMTLQEGDAIYVLAPKDWAEDHLEGHATAGQDL